MPLVFSLPSTPLSLSFLQSLLSVHDTIAQKSYDPELPPLPDDIDDDEDSVKIIRLVKNKEPLVSSVGSGLEKLCGWNRTWRFPAAPTALKDGFGKLTGHRKWCAPSVLGVKAPTVGRNIPETFWLRVVPPMNVSNITASSGSLLFVFNILMLGKSCYLRFAY